MSKLIISLRYLLAITMIIFGLNGFHTFIPIPEMTPQASTFMNALIETDYMLYWWKGIEVFCGLALLFNYQRTIALLLLLPVTSNILMFHLFLDQSGVLIGTLVFTANLLLLRERKELLLNLVENLKTTS